MKKTIKRTALLLSFSLGIGAFLPMANIANTHAYASENDNVKYKKTS